MLEIHLKNIKIFKLIIESIKELVVECNFECNESGISLQSMDSSHVSLISLRLSSDFFDIYKCEKDIVLGINLTILNKCLKFINNEYNLILKYENQDCINIIATNNNKIKEYNIKLLNIENERLEIPDTEYGTTISLLSLDFQNICNELSQIGETIDINITKNNIIFSTENENLNEKINLNFDEESIQKINYEEDLKSTFSSKYLNTFVKAASLSNNVIINLIYESPLLIEYKIDESSYIKYYLAPKIEE